MKILIDISHPAHAFFFRNPIKKLLANNHEVIITSRDKDVAISILEQFGFKHTPLVNPANGGIVDFARELIQRDLALVKLVRQFQPDVMAAIGGTFIAHAGFLTRTPSLVFYDTEFAHMQNAITYPFARYIIVPNCYYGKLPKKKSARYNGYHELSYLHPNYFSAKHEIAIKNGLDPTRDNFLIRIVSWKANHDVGESHWNLDTIITLVQHLATLGNVIISSEAKLPEPLNHLTYQGESDALHHVLAFCRLYVGESATVASEAAVLGIPAIYVSQSDRGYTNEQQQKYQLVKHIKSLSWLPLKNTIDTALCCSRQEWQQKRQQLLDDTIDVSQYVYDCILLKQPASLEGKPT